MRSIEITAEDIAVQVEYFDSDPLAQIPYPSLHLHGRSIQDVVNEFLPEASAEIQHLYTEEWNSYE